MNHATLHTRLELPLMILALLACASPSFAQVDWTIADYAALADSLLPPFDSLMLDVPPGADWLSPLSIAQIAAAVGDQPPDQVSQEGWIVDAQDSQGIRFIRINYDRGRVRWANRERRFDWLTSPHTAIDSAQAEQMTVATADALGIPVQERGGVRVNTVMGMHADTSGATPPFERERLVTIPRWVNGYPVYGSMVRMAVSNQSEPARLLVLWPRFVMPIGLTLRPRQDVIDDVANSCWQAETGAAITMTTRLAYARSGFAYVPAAVTTIKDGESGYLFVTLLIEGPPDADLDGVPDSLDNCIDSHDPRQEDRDSDGVGDLCDNCRDIFNPGQIDLNGDGMGDVCEVVEGACLVPPDSLSNDSCETTTAAICSTLGGTYAGDGTECSDAATDVPPALAAGSIRLRALPNPFNPSVEILFELDETGLGPVRVDLYDVRGRRVRTLLNEKIRVPGVRRVSWNGEDQRGQPSPSGIYFVRVRTMTGSETRKVTLVR